MKKIILILMVLVVAALILPVAVLAAPIGKITALEGKVDMTPAGAKDAVPVAVGVSVNAGDILRAKSKSKAEITFPDGNILRLAENTRVRVTQYQPEEGKKSYVNLFRGKTVAVVDKLKKGANFEVHTPTAICGVRGTVFYSSYQSGQSSFVFQSGAGYGYNINRPDQVVAIPPKVFMVIQGADKAPLLRPATDVEIDKHQKDTTLAGKPKEEGKKEEEKKPDNLKAAKDEGKPKEEKKEELAKPKVEDKKGGEASGPVTDAATQTINQVLLTEKQPIQQSTLLITNPIIQQTKIETIVQKDNTPPDVSFNSGPASLTNQQTATFSYNSNEKVDYQYKLDTDSGWTVGPSSTQSGSTTLNNVPEGSRTLTIKATDSGGNVTNTTYSWTTDYTPPNLSATPQAASPKGNQLADVEISLDSDKNDTYEYKLDGGAYTSTGATLTITNLSAGDHTVTSRATDKAGNISDEQTTSFNLNNHESGGKSWATGDMTSTNVYLTIAGVANESWGSWKITDNGSGTPSSSWNYYAGKANDASGTTTDQIYYWLQKASGTASNNNISGTSSSMRYMNWNIIGQGSNGTVTGSYGDGTWSATDTGRGKYTENPLKFASLVGNWSSNSSTTGSPLIYSRSAAPVETITINPSTYNYPLRFNTNWSSSTDFDSHTWIAPYPDSQKYYHIYYANKGLTGYNKYKYPYAYLDNDSTGSGTENIRYYMFQPGKTFYSVYRYSGSAGTVNLNIYDGNDTKIAGPYSQSFNSNAFWNVFRIDSPLDPLADLTVYRYDTYGVNTPMDLNNRVENEGTITGMLGGTTSIVNGSTTADIPVKLIGSYTQATEKNRFWGQDLVAYNASSSKYTTIDDGTFFGNMGGSFRPGEKRILGNFHAFSINSSGYAGILRGSFGTGNDYPGTIYPGISMWEADGKVSRFDMNINSGFTPSQLVGQWYAISGDPGDFNKNAWQGSNNYLAQTHISTWNSNSGMNERSSGMFMDSSYTQKARMVDREDYIDLYRLTQDADNTFGVWGWRSLGKYNNKSDYANDKWIMDTKFVIRTGDYSSLGAQLFSYGNTWSPGGSFSGQVVGLLGDGDRGFTGVIAGDTAGVFNDSPEITGSYEYNSFGAISTGSWIRTQTYLQMIDDATTGGGREKLAALGYPTTEVALKDPSKNLPGILASKPEAAFVIRNTNLRVFSVPNNDILKIFASAAASSNPDYSVTLSTNSLYPVTSGRELMPVYGSLRPDYKSDSYWIGQLNAFGAFEKTDGSIIQASMSGPVSGPYSSTQFSGTTAGTFVSTPFLSQLTADDKTAALKYYDGSTSSFTTDGELRGLLGATNPVTWTQNSTYPAYTDLQLAGVWWPSLETPVQRSHIFNFPMYPKNFTNGTYTTTTGASFWGYMGGIHQVVNTGNSQDGFEANLATVFVDNNSKAGFLIGKIGGPDAWNPTSYWGFDFNNQAFHIDSNYQQATLVEIATTGITASGLKDYLSSHSKQFSYLGGVSYDPTVTVPQENIGAFYNGTSSAVGAIYMEKSGSPMVGTATTNYMDGGGKWGVWSTDFFGAYVQATHDHWIGELQTPEPLEGEAMPLQRMGSIIYGEPWQNNRIEGSIAGHWASVESGLTGISFGQLLGTFNPNNYTYQAVVAGGFLETNQYLDMTATQSGRETLRSINVPCIQVGNATLSQTGGTASMQNVTMSNVKFFAYSSGAVPQIWATNGVTGTAVGTPAGTANLSGGGLSANFTMKNWDTNNNKWMATVTNGAGSITGGGTNV